MIGSHSSDSSVQDVQIYNDIQVMKLLVLECTSSINEATNNIELEAAFNNFKRLDDHFMSLVRATL